jgi:CRP-like cAMP-binding protein
LLLQRSAIVFGPGVLNALASPQSNTWPLVTLGVWLGGLYFLVHFLVESLGGSLLKPWGLKLWSRFRRLKAPTHKSWPLEDIIKNIEGLPLFSHFHEQHLEKIARGSQVLHFLEGVRIIVQGDPSRDLFVLLEGEVEVLRSSPMSSSEEWSHVMGPISVFGESSLVDESPRLANVHAKRGSTVMRVPVSLLKEVAQEAQSVRQLEVFRNAILVNQFFTSSPVFRSLSPSSIEFLCSRGTLEYFDQNRAVFKQGDKGDSLYLILRGSVAVTVHQTPVKRLHQGSFFGEIALIANIPRTATISTQEPCVFFKISADSFWEVLVQHMDLGVFIESVSETRLKEDLQIVPRSGLAS